jgi:hypothetical protein
LDSAAEQDSIAQNVPEIAVSGGKVVMSGKAAQVQGRRDRREDGKMEPILPAAQPIRCPDETVHQRSDDLAADLCR